MEEEFNIHTKNGSLIHMKVLSEAAEHKLNLGYIYFFLNGDNKEIKKTLIKNFFEFFIEKSNHGEQRVDALINKKNVPELKKLYEEWNDAEQAKEEAEMQEKTRKLREERERIEAESAKFRARLIEIRGLIDSLYPKIEVLMSKFNEFHLIFSGDIDSEIELLKPKKINESVIEKCEARFPTFDSYLQTEDAKFQAKKK
jgi:hypothetical protein